jgi:hypothetical protein
MTWNRVGCVLAVAAMLAACTVHAPAPERSDEAAPEAAGRFGADVAFLSQHQEVVVLSSSDGRARVLVSPAYQGRVMTSTATGESGRSYGWLNRELIASGQLQPHMNAFGGEDRFWLGPEGSRFSLFFPEGAPLEFEHWQTPPPLDSEPFELVSRSQTSASLRKEMELLNYAGTRLSLRVEREVELVDRDRIGALLGVTLPEAVAAVAFGSRNAITNTGDAAWTRGSGAPSIWILGMLQPSPSTTIAVPYRSGPEAELGRVVTQDYFGLVPGERLIVEDGILYFRGDGLERGKIGVPPARARDVAGSYDAASGVLTLVQFSLPETPALYVNSLWTTEGDPFDGDVMNSYNDGPLADGSQLGPFYELESSSPAAFLAPGETLAHVHRTFHFEGPAEALAPIARAVLGVGVEEIAGAFR